MQRRTFLAAGGSAVALAALPPLRAQVAPQPSRTRWRVSSSEGLDGLALLGPLSGGDLYVRHYADDLAAFAPRLPTGLASQVQRLYRSGSDAGFGLVGPGLSVIFSVDGAHETLPRLIAALDARDTALLPSYRASPYWSAESWRWFTAEAGAIKSILKGLQGAGFAAFRASRIGDIDARIAETGRALARFDVIRLQEKLTGRTFEPEIRVVLLQFSKPHGIKVQGQQFLQSVDYETAITVRNAAHEMLHPPVDMNGAAAQAALAVLSRDPLIARIVREHDPKWGYTTLDGLLNEDLCEALDQIISETLGVARNPADRWTRADDGIHVLAAGLYGLLRDDKWAERGGSIEAWLLMAAQSGRLDRDRLHPIAARVLERAPDRLWPLPHDR
jgi:hypothetical protein